MKTKKIIWGSFSDIVRIYNSSPNMTLKELSKVTGFSVDKLKLILMGYM